jgi:DNA polymerase IV
MFQARRLCPQAVVIPPDMAKYASVGREVQRLMVELTPLVEPLSVDEAFLDLAGTTRLHGLSPGKSLARFATRVETSIGITVSIGLSANKFLAKIASDLDKPRGYAVLGVADGRALLAPKPVNFIWGVGRATAARLARNGITTVGDLAAADERELARRYGSEGLRLARLARAIDTRSVMPDREAKSVSAETTFHHDLSDFRALERQLWPLCERVSTRLKAIDRAGSSVTLKLKTADFRLRGRTLALSDPTRLAGRIFAAGRELLTRETDGTRFRLIGIGVGQLVEGDKADPPDLVDDKAGRAAAAEHALDRLRQKFGHDSVIRGLAFDPDRDG